MNPRNWLCIVFASCTAAFLPHETCAQETPAAPVEQIHLVGGSGHGGGGGYSTSVPLDLPGERGGLPVPVSLVHGGMQMGAAGRGWDVPLSYIHVSGAFSLAHRRPIAGGVGVSPQAPIEVKLSLMGDSMKLVPNGTGFVAQRGTQELRVEPGADQKYRVYDGKGRTYTFARPEDQSGELLLLNT